MPATSHPLRRAFATNSTANSFTAKIPIATEPSGVGVFDLQAIANGVGGEGHIPRYIQLIPYGTDADNETHNLRLWGWSRVGVEDIWIPQLLLEIAFTLGSISGAVIGTNHFMADTIIITYGDADAPEISPANELVASILTHLRGVRYIEFAGDLGTGAATNCFWRTMDQG